MIWVDREVEKIKKRKLPLEWVDDMKTPSGRIHVGALRGVVIHDLLYKVLLENKIKSKFTYVFDDHDPMDAIPSYLEFSKWEKYSGMQLYMVPSPVSGYKSFAQYYAEEFRKVFNSINCHPEIIWGSELYNSGKMNSVIKEILNNTNKVREIYNRRFERKKPKDWHPFNVVCENCKKVGTTYIYKWDGKNVHYRCEEKMVAWAKGCGHTGTISPYDGRGKLVWRVDWAAKWKVIGVTVEGAGKDHMSAGGSYDVAKEICDKVLRYPAPYPVAYEWLLIGGKKMSSSKGVGTSAVEVSEILPPDLLRFFIVRTPIQTTLDFNPYGDALLNIFDDYDRCMNAYFDKLEKKIPNDKPGEVLNDFARIIELSQVRRLPKKRMFLPRFRTVVNLIKTKTDIPAFFENQKGTKFNADEKKILEERTVYAQVYLKNYAKQQDQITFLKDSPKDLKLSKNQSAFFKNLVARLNTLGKTNREKIQTIIFESLKESGASAKDVFPIFYEVLIGRDSGPKAADLILEFGLTKVINRLKEIL